MERYTKKNEEGRYYIESANGKLESNIKGHTFGEAIERFAVLENADVKTEVAKEIFADFEKVATINTDKGEIKISVHDYAEIIKKYTKDDAK